MKLRIIGTGSKGNAYVLENEHEALLIEAGVNIKEIKQALDFDYSKVVGCIVTHEHLDHCKSANDLMRLGIDVYTGAKTHQKINGDVIHRAMPIASRETIKLGNFKILALS